MLFIESHCQSTEFLVGGTALQLVTTVDYERPRTGNTMPLHAIGSGRGSIVLYNQASFFHWPVTGKRFMREAEQAHGGVAGLMALFSDQADEVLERR